MLCDCYLDNPGEVFAVEIIIRLEEHLAQPALTNGVVLGVELVKAVESVSIRVHVQHVHGEVVRGEPHGGEHLLQGHLALLGHRHHLVRVVLQCLLDEA